MELPYDKEDTLLYAEDLLDQGLYREEWVRPLIALLASEVARLSNELELLKEKVCG